jgi:hypothetical protein
VRPCWKASNSGSNAPGLDARFDRNVYRYVSIHFSQLKGEANLPVKDLAGILICHAEESGRLMCASGSFGGHSRAHKERRPWRVCGKKEGVLARRIYISTFHFISL